MLTERHERLHLSLRHTGRTIVNKASKLGDSNNLPLTCQYRLHTFLLPKPHMLVTYAAQDSALQLALGTRLTF